MKSRDIVRKAWQITQVHIKKLIWYGAVPAFFGIVVSSVYIAYQYRAFKHSQLFSDQANTDVIDTVHTVWGLISGHPSLVIATVITAVIFLILKILLTPIFHGALISAIMRIKNYEPIDGSFEIGVRRFFPMFEFSLLTGSFSIVTLFTESSFILRWWGQNIFFLALPILLFIAAVGLIASFLFTYSEYYIVLENRRLIPSIGESIILVISNLRKTMLVFILMLLISARVVLNVILVLLIPMLVVGLGSYLVTVFWSFIGIAISGLIGFAVLLVAAYLFGLFNVFTTTVWVLTFAILADKNRPAIRDVDLGKDTFKTPSDTAGDATTPSASTEEQAA